MGVLHGRSKGRSSLTFDLMEPFRATVDRVVLRLVRARTLSRDDVELGSAGVCRVRRELARVVVRAVDAALDCAPMVAVAREAFLTGHCETRVAGLAPSAVECPPTPSRLRQVSIVDYSKARRRSATAPTAVRRGPITPERLADRPRMTEAFRTGFLAMLHARGISLTRLAILCDLQVGYWHQAMGNTRAAPAREALIRAARSSDMPASEVLTLAGYEQIEVYTPA